MEKSKKKLSELTQSGFPFRRQKIEIYEDRIELTVRAPFEHYRIPFYLHSLKEEPDVVFWVPWRTLIVSTLATLAGALLLLLGKRAADPLVGAALAGLGGAALLGSLLSIARLRVYFYKAVGGRDPSHARYVPQLYVYPDRPTVEEVRRFEDVLKIERDKQIEKARIDNEDPILYARELERFANLRKQERVTEKEYALVRAKLLNIKPTRIGF